MPRQPTQLIKAQCNHLAMGSHNSLEETMDDWIDFKGQQVIILERCEEEKDRRGPSLIRDHEHPYFSRIAP